MTGQEIFNVVGGALLTLLGWLGRQLWDAVSISGQLLGIPKLGLTVAWFEARKNNISLKG